MCQVGGYLYTYKHLTIRELVHGYYARLICEYCLRSVYKPHFVQRKFSWAIIYLCSLPEMPRVGSSSSLLGFASDGGYLAACIAANTGGLLHHLFTMTLKRATCFCGPDPIDCSIPSFPRRRALRSTDFPRSRQNETAITRPT